jgi:SHS2 domain-containing protein
MFEFFDHEADLGLAVEAGDLTELFAEGARALTASHTEISAIRPVITRGVKVYVEDRDELFVRWLKEWLYLQNSEGYLAGWVGMTELTETAACGLAKGEIRAATRHPVIREIKAVTYHGACIRRTKNGWRAEVILDV